MGVSCQVYTEVLSTLEGYHDAMGVSCLVYIEVLSTLEGYHDAMQGEAILSKLSFAKYIGGDQRHITTSLPPPPPPKKKEKIKNSELYSIFSLKNK